LGAKVSFQ